MVLLDGVVERVRGQWWNGGLGRVQGQPGAKPAGDPCTRPHPWSFHGPQPRAHRGRGKDWYSRCTPRSKGGSYAAVRSSGSLSATAAAIRLETVRPVVAATRRSSSACRLGMRAVIGRDAVDATGYLRVEQGGPGRVSAARVPRAQGYTPCRTSLKKVSFCRRFARDQTQTEVFGALRG